MKKTFCTFFYRSYGLCDILTESACNGTIVEDEDLGEVIQLQGDQRKDAFEFLTDKKDGLGLPQNIVKVCFVPADNSRRSQL